MVDAIASRYTYSYTHILPTRDKICKQKKRLLPITDKSVHSRDEVFFLFGHIDKLPFDTSHFCILLSFIQQIIKYIK